MKGNMKYGIYIIESLSSEPRDGKVLEKILNVCEMPCKYEHVETISDFKIAIENFNKC
jgi:hypothetical protein